MSHRFGFTSRWSVGPEDKSPFARRFSIHGFTQISLRPVRSGKSPTDFRDDVAGDAIALPEFWSASGACARKGLAESAYAIKLRLLDATELRVFVA